MDAGPHVKLPVAWDHLSRAYFFGRVLPSATE